MENSSSSSPHSRASGRSVAIIVIVLVLLFAGIFLFGWTRHDEVEKAARADAKLEATTLPTVTITVAARAASVAELTLPGNIQAITEAAVLARAEGYLVKRYADIGDRVREGQLLAELDTPDLDQQVVQAQAALQQTNAALAQAKAAREQSKANAQLADVTAKRNTILVSRGVLSKQEGDQSDATLLAQTANVSASDANVNAALQNVGANEANLRRLLDLQAFKKVRAPFDGVITLRNIDTGSLISSGSTLLFRIAQNNVLRIFVNVPQSDFSSFRVGMPAGITVSELPGKTFTGKVSRLSGALDTNTRTLLTEVEVPNAQGTLLPGMYAQVHFSITRTQPAVVVPGDAIVTRANGPMVAVVDSDNTVHFRLVHLGRDFGTKVEILGGLEAGEQVVVNPTDDVREGAKVKTTMDVEPGAARQPAAKPAQNGGSAAH
ncbi:MAG: efflux RND transporter periplasmic adaptor subunit [Bryobacteraceae bacterium]